jgi:hypothetical protein
MSDETVEAWPCDLFWRSRQVECAGASGRARAPLARARAGAPRARASAHLRHAQRWHSPCGWGMETPPKVHVRSNARNSVLLVPIGSHDHLGTGGRAPRNVATLGQSANKCAEQTEAPLTRVFREAVPPHFGG